MKKQIFILFFMFLSILTVYCQTMDLDSAIKESVMDIAPHLPVRTRIAVTDFYAPRTVVSNYIINEMIKQFINYGRFDVVERQNIDRARNEILYNMSDEVSDDTRQRAGRFLGAQVVVFGKITKIGNAYRMEVRANYAEENVILRLFTANISEKDIKKKFGTDPGTRYTIYNSLAILGYNYSPDLPVGFSVGFAGVYTSMGFAFPDWGSYKRHGVDCRNSNLHSAQDFNSTPYTDQRYENITWLLGYNLTIIPGMLYLPVGAGIDTVKEWRLQEVKFNIGSTGNPEWCPASEWETSFLLEAGLLFRPIKNKFSPYIYGTYRYITSNKHTFSVGGGISYEKQK